MLWPIAISLFFFSHDSLLEEGLNYAYRQEYQKAESCFYLVAKNFSSYADGYFFQAALLQLYMFDHNTDSLKDRYFQLLDSTITLAKSKKNNFYLGAAYAYRAVFEGWRKNYWPAFYWGIKTPPLFQRVLIANPKNYDVYLGIGIVEYFKSRAFRYIPGLRLFGSKERAINQIKLASRYGGHFLITAQYALAWIFVSEKEFLAAESILQELLNKYPENRTFLRLLRDLYFQKKDYKKCLAVAEELKINMLNNQPQNLGGQAENELVIGKCYYYLKDWQKAYNALDPITKIHYFPKDAVRLRDYYHEAKGFIKKIGRE